MNDHDPGDEHNRRRIGLQYEGLWPRAYALKERRRDENICLNGGPRSKVEHGPVTRGGKCQRCLDIHARSR